MKNRNWRPFRLTHPITQTLTLAALLYFAHEFQFELSKRNKLAVQEQLHPPLGLLSPKVIEVLSLGHKRLYDDLIFIWLLQYLVPDEGESQESTSNLEKRIHNTLKFSPENEAAYTLPCFLFAFKFQKPESCLQPLKLGLNVLPKHWRIPAILGYIYFFLLNDRVNGEKYYQLAAERGAPDFISSLSKKIGQGSRIPSQDLQKQLKNIFDSSVPQQAHKLLFKN